MQYSPKLCYTSVCAIHDNALVWPGEYFHSSSGLIKIHPHTRAISPVLHKTSVIRYIYLHTHYCMLISLTLKAEGEALLFSAVYEQPT